jgi:RimJ/RimL family protein N-acetyltransferase
MGHRIPSTERLVDPGTLLATTHPVGGGLRVRLRLARPSDGPRMRAFLEGLSAETRSRRFLHAMPTVPDTLVRLFTFYDPRVRLVVVGVAMDPAGREQIIGVADVVHLGDGLAELGAVVDDERQGRGVGKLLTEVVASLALQQGASRLKAELLTENQAMLHLMQRLGRTVSTVEDGVSVVYATLPAARRRSAA